ncbi:MAG TPA: RNA polymerase sigma factor [Caulobacteraceae bacterium]|nr:RNA polymerase sigma factor [Caulobacteraceae bacterium]
MSLAQAIDYDALDELGLVRRILARDAAAARHLLTANNQRLFRAAWSILGNRGEAEEAVQDGYMKAFAAMPGFKGEAKLSTWLTRIVVNEALDRRRRHKRQAALLEERGVAVMDDYREALMQGSTTRTPEQAAMRRELGKLMERAVRALPETFRPVFVMREIEDMSVAETAAALGLTEQTVRTRLYRAKERLKLSLAPEMAEVRAAALPFAGLDCQALTARVMEKLGFA